ncbi:hypothetical protein [Bradyrhizobium sp. CB1015]|uniref:hypothetical protein n=1 Tax=Bradyrhizobium sp. CB1015 TaxID=2976822 RepID=UPI0021A9DA17|nr:hypothetical protein [Bradyrhizobium sp. CB1015]UWU94357.1 hypothetical protein N2604_11175 [Bradyrhizobium sp. CB1015]
MFARRSHRVPLASSDRGSRIEWIGMAQDARHLAVGPDDWDLHTSRRDAADIVIAHATHTCAERTLPSVRNTRAPHEHDDILQRQGNASRLFDVHVGPLMIVQRKADFGRSRGRAMTD